MRTSNLQARYTLTPQMLDYDKMRQFTSPYISQSNEPNMNSKVITTDRFGTRRTLTKDGYVDRINFKGDGYVFLGGSVCMGWGATSDARTIPSYFCRIRETTALNLGLMAGNSEMEVISSLPYAQSNNFFVSITGNNTLNNELCKELYEHCFWDGIYEPMMPFNEEFWSILYKNDLLFNSYLLRNDVIPSRYYKTTEDKRRFRQLLMKRIVERILRRRCETNNLPVLEDSRLQKAVDRAVINIVRNMQNLYTLSRGMCLFAIQPFMFSDNRSLTAEEECIADEHKKYCNAFSRRIIYEMMPRTYRSFCNGVMKACEQLQLPFVDLSYPPEGMWFFSDTSHFTDDANEYAANIIVEKVKEVKENL